jgi:molybdopterin converting factor small subunit
MKIQLTAFGIAKDILQSKSLEIELRDGDTISTLKQNLFVKYPDFLSLKSISFAVGENYQADTYTLHDNDEVVIIPPVSGG